MTLPLCLQDFNSGDEDFTKAMGMLHCGSGPAARFHHFEVDDGDSWQRLTCLAVE